MKYFFLPAGLLLLAAGAQAQTSSGTILLGGNIGYANSKQETSYPNQSGSQATISQTDRFTFSPQVGTFITDNLAIGAQVGLSMTTEKSPVTYFSYNGYPLYSDRTSKNTAIHVGPFVRYYHMVGDKAGFYGQLTAGYATEKTEDDYETPSYNDVTYKYKGGFADLTPGFVFFPTDKLGLELTLGSLSYANLKGELENPPRPLDKIRVKQSYLEARFGLSQLMVGASFYLGGK